MTAPRDVAVAYVLSFASGDPDVIAGWVTDGFVNEHAAALGSGCTGRDAYRQRLPGFLADFEGLAYAVEDTVAEGDRVVVAYRMTARHRGAPIDLRGVMRLRIDGDRVAHRVDHWDALTFQQQAGLV